MCAEKLHLFFNKWSIISKQNAPMRKRVRRLAEEKIVSKTVAWLREVFSALRSVLIGRFSTKQAIIERRRMTEDIRRDLSAKMMDKGLVGVVPQYEIRKELYRRVLLKFEERKRLLLMQFVFSKGLLKIFLKARRLAEIARSHVFSVKAGRCFYAWSDYVYLVGLGLDRKRWSGPRKYEVLLSSPSSPSSLPSLSSLSAPSGLASPSSLSSLSHYFHSINRLYIF
jgi:hypothetical protein